MSNPCWGTIVELKNQQYLNITGTSYDTELQTLLEAITDRAVLYIDDEDLDETAYSPSLSLIRAILLQATYEWRRKNDIGLSSQTFPDGSVNKYDVSEWLSEVKKILDRIKRYNI